MPEHIRSLVVILFISTIVFAFARKPASQIIQSSDFIRRRNLWIALTLVAFLAQNIWLCFLITTMLILFTRSRETNPAALYFLLLFILPAGGFQIPAMGLVNFLFDLSYPRLLALVILLPTYIALVRQKQTVPFGRTTPDKLLIIYIILSIFLYFRDTTLTNALRQSFYQFTDILLPYYVISRSLKEIKDFRAALLSLIIAAMILAAIGIFESTRNWYQYSALSDIYDMGVDRRLILRSEFLRARASSDHPIVLGYIVAIAIGFLLYLQRSITSSFSRRMALLLLWVGLLAPLSRGPWIGVVCIIMVFIATGKNPVRKLSTLFLAGIVAIPLIAIMPGGEKVFNLIPFIGETEKRTFDYRVRLYDNSMTVMKRNPWFGSTNFLDTPEMESLGQGKQIVDLVNSYLEISLARGFIGVALFIGFFLTICWGIYQGFRRQPDKSSDEYLLGRSLLATLAGILIIIATVSNYSFIPILYWSVAGLGVAYINMMKRFRISQHAVDKHTVKISSISEG
ncbi:MAG: O-antigen ligase family protein [bacterium]